MPVRCCWSTPSAPPGWTGRSRRRSSPWRKPTAVHDPAKILLDLAVSLAVGGDCLADVAVLRAAPEVFGRVASDPTVSRLISTLAGDADGRWPRSTPPAPPPASTVWARAGRQAPDHGADHRRPLLVDIDATLVTAHSEKEQAAPTFKRGFGHHPLTAFVDHGQAGTGEPVAMLLRRGNAGSNTAADHITVIRSALSQLPADNQHGHRSGRSVLIRVDGAGSTHELLDWLTARSLSYSVGFGLPDHTADLLATDPRLGVVAGAGRRRRGPRRRLGRRAHRAAQPRLAGRRGCGSSPGSSARTPARSCGSPTTTATGSPRSPPTPAPAAPAPRSPSSNCATAAAPAARTASAPRRTPA